jgi:hypothetical protein
MSQDSTPAAPEKRHRSWLHWPLRAYKWLVVFLLLGLLSNILLLLLSYGLKDWLSQAWNQVAAVGDLVRQHPQLSAGAAAVLLVLFVLSILAEREADRQQQAVAAARVTQAAAATATAIATEFVERARSIGPQGPPMDLGLLRRPARFVGRVDDLQWAENRLRQRDEATVTALTGMGGIGKTALAAEAAHIVFREGRFKDGVAVVFCQGKRDALSVLREALSHFDPYRRLPDAREDSELAQTARALLGGKETLIVLDNVEPELDVERVIRPLRAAGATLLLTAQQHLSAEAVPAGESRRLALLPPEEALGLFAQFYGRLDVGKLDARERDGAASIVTVLACHTLAIRAARRSTCERRRACG